MRKTIQGAVLGALVAAGVSVLLAQSPTWTSPRTWATDDLLTATQFNAQFRDNLLWLRQDAQLTGTAALLDLGCGTLGTNEVLFSDCTWATIPAVTIDALGCSGTPSADTVLFGDCRWDSIPATTVVALDMGSTTTTASTYQTVGPTASIGVSPGQAVTIYVSGEYRLDTNCDMRLRNTTTAIDLFETTSATDYGTDELSAASFEDASPSSTTDNTYALQISRVTAPGLCRWNSKDVTVNLDPFLGVNNRGLIAVVTG